MRMVIKLDDFEATPKQVKEGLEAIEGEFKRLMELPEVKRRTRKTRKRMLRLQMLKGYLSGLNRVR